MTGSLPRIGNFSALTHPVYDLGSVAALYDGYVNSGDATAGPNAHSQFINHTNESHCFLAASSAFS